MRVELEELWWEFIGDIGQLCIGNWISLVLRNTETEFLNAADMSISF